MAKKFKCSNFTKQFDNISHLNAHMTIHTGRKPYACDKCTKTFTAQSSLISHRIIHTGEKPFSCDKCFTFFTTTKIVDESHDNSYWRKNI